MVEERKQHGRRREAMRIRNKDRLVKRAEKDHEEALFIANTYLTRRPTGRDSGKPFQGCLIGCLAVPDNPASRKSWLAESRNGMESIEKISRDFGICMQLQRVAEIFLMALPDESSARLGQFTVSFCRALPEGAEVDNELVERWIMSRTGDEPDIYHLDDTNPAERKAFLDWLRRGAPEPRARK
jgi:hypothetical protein